MIFVNRRSWSEDFFKILRNLVQLETHASDLHVYCPFWETERQKLESWILDQLRRELEPVGQKRVKREGRAPSGGQGRKPYDPLLNSKHWRVTVRGYWVERKEPCRRCGGAIDYNSPRFYPGTSRVNPLTLAVGHIVGRHEARLKGWPDAQINDISNTQPEHARCSDSSGAVYGNQYRGHVRRLERNGITLLVNETQPELDGSREW